MEEERKKTISIDATKLQELTDCLLTYPIFISAFVGLVTFLAAFPPGAIVLIGLFIAGVVLEIKLKSYRDVEEAPDKTFERLKKRGIR